MLILSFGLYLNAIARPLKPVAIQGAGFSYATGAIDITPPALLPLGGYTARGNKVMEPGGKPLYAKILVLKGVTTSVAIVAMDGLTIPDSLADEVRRQLPTGVHLFLCATHTHSAPDTQMLNRRMTFPIPGIATFQQKWLTWYSEKIAAGINKTLLGPMQSVQSVSVKNWKVDVNRGRRKLANPIKTASVLELNGQPMIFNYAAHPTFYTETNLKTNPDWPGEVGSVAKMVIQGALGDTSPKATDSTGTPVENADPETKIADFWTAIRESEKDAVKDPVSGPDGPRLGYVIEPIKLPAATPSAAFMKAYRVPKILADGLVKGFAPPTASIRVITLGKLAILGVPGEPTSRLGRRIRDAGLADGFKDVWVVSHCDGWIGYILDADDQAEGGYEATLNFYGPTEGDLIVSTAESALKMAIEAK